MKLIPITANDAALLQAYDQQRPKPYFTEKDLANLQSPDIEKLVSFVVYNRARKVLDEHHQKMQRAISRREVMQMCVMKFEFDQWKSEEFFTIFEEYIAVREMLVEKGILTNEEIDAKVALRAKDREKAAIMAFKQQAFMARGLKPCGCKPATECDHNNTPPEELCVCGNMNCNCIKTASELEQEPGAPDAQDTTGLQDSAEAEIEKKPVTDQLGRERELKQE